VSLAFANESTYSKSARIVHASIYCEYFGWKIFVIGSKVQEQRVLGQVTQLLICNTVLL